MIEGIYTFNLMHAGARKYTVNKEGQNKTWIINDKCDRMGSSFNIWECVHCISQIAAKSPLEVEKKPCI